ncbi:MAG: hypothetical protein ACYC6Y_07865 [Thermoguttaceae bacterium]
MASRTLSLALLLVLAAAITAAPRSARGDCGKIIIYRVPPTYVWPPLPPPRPPVVDWDYNSHNTNINSGNTNINSGNRINSNNQIIQNSNINTGTQINIAGGVMPRPASNQFLSAGMGFTFKEPEQNAVIAWDGKEEILILSTDEQNQLEGGGAVLSVLPLPGKPTSVLPASTEAFQEANRLIRSKLAIVGMGQKVLTAKIGTHNIFVWKIDSPDDFGNEVRAYIKKTYQDQADAHITDDVDKIVRQYFDQGFRYFAFDLTFMSDKDTTKVAIAYRFESKFVYYPLVISKIGGKGETTVELAVFTREQLHNFGGLDVNQIKVIGNQSVDVTAEELKKVDAEAAELMGGQAIKARIMTLTGQVNGFDGDLMAW